MENELLLDTENKKGGCSAALRKEKSCLYRNVFNFEFH